VRSSFSLLNDHSQLAIDTAILRIFCIAIRRTPEGFLGGDNFKLHDLKVAFGSLEYLV